MWVMSALNFDPQVQQSLSAVSQTCLCFTGHDAILTSGHMHEKKGQQLWVDAVESIIWLFKSSIVISFAVLKRAEGALGSLGLGVSRG